MQATNEQGEILKGKYKLTDENAFVEEMKKLMNEEQEIDVQKVSVVSLGNEVTIEPEKLVSIGWMFDEQF